MPRFLSLLALLSASFMPPIASAASVRTLAFDLPGDKASLNVHIEAAPEKIVKLEVQANQFGTPAALAPGSYVVESSSFKLPSRFILPANSSSSYLLLILPKSDGGCLILPVADDSNHFKKGDRFVINATIEDLAIRIHTQKYLLKPGRSAYYQLPPPPVPDNRIEVEMLRQVTGRWLAFNSTYWPLSPNSRSIVLIYPDPNTGRPRVRSLADRPRPPAAKTE
jgi:hypothetical protein